MSTEQNQEVYVDTQNNEGEGNESSQAEVVTISKTDYDKLNQTLGSYKRELKDLKKPKEEPKETPTTNQQSDNALLMKLEKMALRQAGVTHPEDIELAQKTAKKWNVDIDDVLSDEDFKTRLGRQQSERSNVEATSGVKGGSGGGSQAKNTLEYWQAKGNPPTPADVPDRKIRQKIVRQMMQSAKSGGGNPFYNG
jgi:hypothetical protein